MTCISQPELTDDQISDLLDGHAAADVEEHLSLCPYCRERYRQAQQFERQLRQRLYRWDCPDSDTLRDYVFDLLDTKAQKQVAEHLEKCLLCRDELRHLNEFLGKEDIPESLPARLAHTSRRALPNVWRPQPIQGLPAFAMRGRDSSETLMLETNGITIFLEVQPEDESLWLSGRLVAADIDDWTGALVEVWQGKDLQAAASVKDGGFRCRLHNMESVDIKISPKSGAALLIEQIRFANEPPE